MATRTMKLKAYARKAYAQMDRAQLLTMFEPSIDNALEATVVRMNNMTADAEKMRYDCAIAYKGELGDGNLMFVVQVGFTGLIVMDDLIAIAQALTVFETCEYEPVEYCGMKFTLGDGDDRLAVQFIDGKIEVWLRAWHPDHVGGV